jgi:hypothetical protein
MLAFDLYCGNRAASSLAMMCSGPIVGFGVEIDEVAGPTLTALMPKRMAPALRRSVNEFLGVALRELVSCWWGRSSGGYTALEGAA